MVESSKRAGSVVIAAVLIAGLFFIGSNLAGWGPFKGLGGEPYTQVGPAVVESVRDVAKLTTVEMVEYTTVEKGNDFGWLNWARGDRIFLFAVARIGAGVDMAQVTTADFEVDEDLPRYVKENRRDLAHFFRFADAAASAENDRSGPGDRDGGESTG